MFEFFTVDGGATIGIKDLIRNRDVDLSGMSITGNLSIDNLSSSGTLTATGNVSAAGNLITSGSRINTNYAYVTLTNNQNFFANAYTSTLFFDTASSTTIANARIALPTAAEDGKIITISFLAPITSVWVNKANTADVKWFPNSSVSSGNVVAQFTYSTANSNWLRS